MTIFVSFLTSRYFNKGAYYSFYCSVSLVLVLKTPKNLFSNITYSWMRHADSDKNVKKAGKQQHINARM